ncbi:hypothetical protein WN51_05108 [Melipona quadrifasciata]|uniref:Uncharacterized protein n=1 Tax=Melipona quadrifasciata TaxID=166423 RepID=A0A0N0BCV7_9HYME|nr:hypothetical protein WN51_05108 [Melipona quadrifasciata]
MSDRLAIKNCNRRRRLKEKRSIDDKFKPIIERIPKVTEAKINEERSNPPSRSRIKKSITVSTEPDLETTEQDTPLHILKSTYFPMLLDLNLSKNSSNRISRPEVSQSFSKNTNAPPP